MWLVVLPCHPTSYPTQQNKWLMCVTQYSPAMACCICFVAATSVHAELDDRSSSVLALSSCICTLYSDSWQQHIFMSSHYTHTVTHLYMSSHYTHRLTYPYMISHYTHRLTHLYTSSNYTHRLTHLYVSLHYTHRLTSYYTHRLSHLHVITLHTDLCTSPYYHTTHTWTYTPLHVITLHTQTYSLL